MFIINEMEIYVYTTIWKIDMDEEELQFAISV